MASQKAMINTMALYHWDNTLFDGMQLPESLSRDDVVAAILEETCDFPVIYTDLETLRFSINKWSAHRSPIWQHFIDTTEYEYNPIENYNRVEAEDTTATQAGTGSMARSGTDTTTDKVSAYNDSDFSNREQSATLFGSTNTETRGFTDTLDKDVTIHGNIGVMSTQDMIKQEREIADFDIIDIIVSEYKTKYCILKY